MEVLDKDTILKEIPLFSGLSDSQRDLIKEKIRFVEYKKNEIIYEEGSPPSNFYCIILGRVVIYAGLAHGQETVLEYLHRGKYFGIISLLTAEPHSATTKAVNDCLILEIKKEDFDFILEKIPSLAVDLSRTLSRRLKRKDLHPKTVFESTIISVFSSHSQAGKTVYALNLGLSLYQETRKSLIILDIVPQDKLHSMPQRLGITGSYQVINLSSPFEDAPKRLKGFILKSEFNIDLLCLTYKAEDELCIKRTVSILSLLLNDYHYIILDLPSLMDKSVFSMLNQSDLIHILSGTRIVDLERTHNLIDRLRTEFNFQEAKINVILNEYRLSRISHEQQMEFLAYKIFATLPKIELLSCDRLVLDAPDCEYAKAVRRISRSIGDSLVGLALGVGVAYGFCHIGVFKVIEEEKIPIDIICGSSIGALLASLWVTGRSADEILEITKEFREPKYIWRLTDLTFPILGLLKGGKLHSFLKRHLGNKTFYDVKIPLKIIASNIKRKESIILDKGLLTDAIMASCAMPGIFAPFRLKEQMLLDGGVINPLPTEPLLEMGVKKIIAVNVTPSKEDVLRQYEEVKKEVGVVRQKKKLDLGQYFRERFKTNILDIIFSSIEIMQSEIAKKEAKLADVVLHPDTQGLHWLELHRAADFARRGEEEARKNLDKIWQVVNE